MRVNAIVATMDTVAGKFAARNIGKRTEETSHEWAQGAAGHIADAPADVAAWLMLADKLDEENNPAAHMIRLVFTEGYQAPAGYRGYITRSASYHESGTQYTESLMLAYSDNGGFETEQWGAGMQRYGSTLTRDEAVALVTQAKGRHVNRFGSLTITGHVYAVRRVLPAGSKVSVTRPGWKASRKHVTQTAVSVNNFVYVSLPGDTTAVVQFTHDGYTVQAFASDVEGTAY